MPNIVFGSTSLNTENRIDTSLFVQGLYLTTHYLESDFDEDFDLKNRSKFKTLLDINSDNQAAIEKHVFSMFMILVYQKTLHMLTSMTKVPITFVL